MRTVLQRGWERESDALASGQATEFRKQITGGEKRSNTMTEQKRDRPAENGGDSDGPSPLPYSEYPKA